MEECKGIVRELEDVLGRCGYVRFRQPELPGEYKIAYVRNDEVVIVSNFPKADDLIIQSVKSLEKVALGIAEDQEKKLMKTVKRLSKEKGDGKGINKGDAENIDNENRCASPLLVKYFKGRAVKIETFEPTNEFTCTILDVDNLGILVEARGKKMYIPIYNVLTVEEADF